MMRPMLADPVDLSKLRYPVLASPKLDGIRGLVYEGRLLSRTLKPIPNRHVQQLFARPELAGFDGELIVGDPTSKSVYRDTTSAVMSHAGEPDVRFYAFDICYAMELPYRARFELLANRWAKFPHDLHKIVVPHVNVRIDAEAALLAEEERVLELGYEGLILRDPEGPYKYGRSTTREGWLLKFKRFVDGEAVVIDVEEEMHNTNAAETNELGRTKRSSAQAGQVGKGTMGALIVRDMASNVEFKIGTGFDALNRREEWKPGDIVKYKHFPIGVKNAPRHPVFLGRRSPIDMGEVA